MIDQAQPDRGHVGVAEYGLGEVQEVTDRATPRWWGASPGQRGGQPATKQMCQSRSVTLARSRIADVVRAHAHALLGMFDRKLDGRDDRRFDYVIRCQGEPNADYPFVIH